MSTDTAYRRSQERLREGYDKSREVVEEHPLSTAATVFGLGFGLGLAVGLLLAEGESSRKRSWYSRYGSRDLEHFGRQVLDALSQVVPDAVSKRLQ